MFKTNFFIWSKDKNVEIKFELLKTSPRLRIVLKYLCFDPALKCQSLFIVVLYSSI